MRNSEIVKQMKPEQWTYGTMNDGKGKHCILGYILAHEGIEAHDDTELYYLAEETYDKVGLDKTDLEAIIGINDRSPTFEDAQKECVEYLEMLEN